MTTLTQLSMFDEPQPEVEEIPLSAGTKCHACGAEIVWRRTKSGKPAPLNPALKYVSGNGHGKRLFLIGEDGASVQGFECNPHEKGARCGRVNHFATCPKADEFRR
jgi:hypothetical protein